MHILKNLDKDNLHHAYLIEGARDEVVSEIFSFLKNAGIETVGNPDVSHLSVDTFKIDDARSLKSFTRERANTDGKKIFIISTNNFLLDAQNSLLKMFEEPIEHTHFFLVVPDASALLKTFVSRFYVVSARQDFGEEIRKDAEKFISMPLGKRIDFIKELTAKIEGEDDGGNEIAVLDSSRSRSLKFLNSLEFVLHKKLLTQNSLQVCFRQIFKVRKFLRQPGSSTKTLMESVALVMPNFTN